MSEQAKQKLEDEEDGLIELSDEGHICAGALCPTGDSPWA